jgi:hypothetical protein
MPEFAGQIPNGLPCGACNYKVQAVVPCRTGATQFGQINNRPGGSGRSQDSNAPPGHFAGRTIPNPSPVCCRELMGSATSRSKAPLCRFGTYGRHFFRRQTCLSSPNLYCQRLMNCAGRCSRPTQETVSCQVLSVMHAAANKTLGGSAHRDGVVYLSDKALHSPCLSHRKGRVVFPVELSLVAPE